ncbi:MAG: FAD-binding oxidoreductase, partial [Cucumibacter sp.]
MRDEPKTEPKAVAEALAGLIGAGNVLTGAAAAAHFEEPRGLYHQKALAVATPRSVADVQKLLAWANGAGVKIVPQGGNTGLVGGQVPDRAGEVIVSLRHLRDVREVDAEAGVLIVEAGLTVAEAQRIAEQRGLLFPLSLGSEGSAQIGGVLSTNAGGVNVLAYGNTRDFCLGIEAVLADGRLYQGLSPLRKDNTGYSLRNLFIGAEGTLGIITAASFRLYPRPVLFETALVNVASPAEAVRLYEHLRAAGGNRLTSIELLPRFAIELELKHELIERDPSASMSPWYVLCEFSLFGADAPGALAAALEGALEKGIVTDAAIAETLGHR